MIRNKINISLISVVPLILSVFLILNFSNSFKVNADPSSNCEIKILNCATKDVKPDLNCVANKFVDPKSTCCSSYCSTTVTPHTVLSDEYRKFVIFGTEYRLDPASIPSLIRLMIQTILGLISLYTLFRGVYLAGFKRTADNNTGDIEKINKEFTNLVIGFVISWSFIFILQLVGGALGLGSLTTLQVKGTGPSSGTTIIIK